MPARRKQSRNAKPSSAAPPSGIKAGVIGLGYVGLPLLVEMAKAGYEVVGVDLDRRKVSALNRGESYIDDVSGIEVAALRKARRISASSDYAALADCDAISICVPTPLRKTKDPDLSYIVNSVEALAPHLKKGVLIILESTTYPGTTEELALPRLETGGRLVGQDFFLAFSPERVDPANKVFTTRNTPKVLGGITDACTARAAEFYGRVFEKVVVVKDTRTAEMVKLLENTFRAVNIGLVNEIAIMCERLRIDVWEVIGAAATKPFGFMPFYPGPGLGGHCIPIDPLYLSWKLRSLNYTARFIELASEINTSMPRYVLDRVVRSLNARGKAVKGARVLVLGVAYKRDVSDVRESPAVDVIMLLKALGARVSYADPHVPLLEEHGLSMKASRLTPAAVRAADAVLIITDHRTVDYAMVAKNAKYVMDARNAIKGPRRKNVERL